jgi:hypothetical protein
MRTVAVLVGLCLVIPAAQLHAQNDSAGESDQPAFTLRSSFKTSALFAASPDGSAGADGGGSAGFWRLRLEPTIRFRDYATVEFAVEQRFRMSSSGADAAGGIVPAYADAPYRIRQLDWQLGTSDHAEWRAEIDRAAIRATIGRANLTIGRQSVGWGRGVLFGVVDLYSPFSPLEADREWRRGVDALRADIKLSERVSFDAVGAYGQGANRSIVAGRLRGYVRAFDLELVGGRRARDSFGGITSSAPVGAVEIHGEAAVFRTPGPTVAKALAGASYRVPVGHGLLISGEYHYSGFGARSPADIPTLLADADFQQRYLRGDTQILGRHAVAVLASYDYAPELSLSGQWLQSPTDGSGVVVPSTTMTFGDRWSLSVNGYLPYGDRSSAHPGEFGFAARALFSQLKVYR